MRKGNEMGSEARYDATVPDTLDLAERAALSVNALTGAADPDHNYETYHGGHLDHTTPYMSHRAGGPCMMKPVHALPLMRIMSGSTQNADYDAKMMEACTRTIEDDGLWWLPVEGRPWRQEVYKRDHVCIVSHARFMVALMDWYEIDGDSRWLDIVRRMADGLAELASHNEDRTWYNYAYTREGWQRDLSLSVEFTGDEQKPSRVEPERTSIYLQGHPLRAFSRWYAVSGDRRFLELAQRIARHMYRPGAWGTDEGPSMVSQAEHALWHGHYHSYTMGMKGMAEYAIATHDSQAMEFVARFYEWARYFGISRMGFFPAVVGPLESVKESVLKGYGEFPGVPCEACCIGDMTWLAARLSESGIGDYWEDVDQYARNQLIEHQLVDRGLIEAMIEAGPDHEIDARMETAENVLERNIGCFISGTDPTWAYGWWTMCCNANVPMGLYKAWAGIVQGSGDVAQVNLLPNRASALVDVNSYLPYEGKVVLMNKSARKVHVRMPRWVHKKDVLCHLNGRHITADWLNNRLVLEDLKPGDSINIEFPLVETVEKHTEVGYDIEYTCRFKGNTLVDISPRGERPGRTFDASDDGGKFSVNKGYPIYLRDHYKAGEAPLKTVERYVAPKVI